MLEERESHGASGKTIDFGILKRDENVYSEIVPDASKKQLQQVIRDNVVLVVVV